jgi:hypothetical protein
VPPGFEGTDGSRLVAGVRFFCAALQPCAPHTDQAISFRAVARLADCSPDFRCRTPSLRARIAQLRAQPRRATASEPPARDESTSNVVRELAAQVAHEKRRRREAVAALQAALAAAHGELLALRHQLAVGQPRPAA